MNNSDSLEKKRLADLDVEVSKDDVRFHDDSSVPEITFSDRVHDTIDRKLAHSTIVRLLGKTIGYRALLNRIQALWSLRGAFNLIDLVIPSNGPSRISNIGECPKCKV
ncbi:hypothetical protein GQ457_07G003170 [Hibiscus cannabinus]